MPDEFCRVVNYRTLPYFTQRSTRGQPDTGQIAPIDLTSNTTKASTKMRRRQMIQVTRLQRRASTNKYRNIAQANALV